jgi:hypothetical protein
MKTRILTVCTTLVLGTILVAFAPLRGGESFTLHINNKQVVEHYFTSKAATPSVSLADVSANDQISVYYNECGKIGTNRKLMLKDEQGRVLKEFSFADASGEHTPMTVRASEIMAFKKSDRSSVSLVYASKLVSMGRVLASLALTSDVQTTRKQ